MVIKDEVDDKGVKTHPRQSNDKLAHWQAVSFPAS
jgi:hypothetical protein